MDKKDKEEYYMPPPKLSTGDQVMQFLWNPETKQCLGRTAGSWIRILIFYAVFYIVLSIYWGGLWLAFRAIALNPFTPRYMLKESLIGSNPGLGYRPMPAEEFVESALIWYNHNDPGFVNWTSQLNNFLKPYRAGAKGNNVVDCNNLEPAPPGKVCRVAIDKMSPCNEHPYSYEKGSPCIYLKLNKIFNWVPEYYNDTKNLPGSMPKDLQIKIKDKESKDRRELNMVWVSCEGENAADKENIGPIHLLPNPGFSGYYFPFSNVENYLSPLVAVWFERPVRGVLINIECKAWAKNIVYDRHDRRGSVHFELMVD